jgi:hypothetical protein
VFPLDLATEFLRRRVSATGFLFCALICSSVSQSEMESEKSSFSLAKVLGTASASAAHASDVCVMESA